MVLPQPASCHLGQKVLLTSIYQYSVENDTHEDHIYTLIEELIIEGKIKKNQDLFLVPAHNIKSRTDVLDFFYMPVKAGKFSIRSKIKVIGATTKTDFKHQILSVS